MCLFHFSTCFEQHSANHQENQLYKYIIWYISCVGGRLVCRSCIPDGHLHRVIYTSWCIDTIDSPDDGHCVARNMFLFYWRYNPFWVCILQPSSGVIASSLTRFLDHTQRRATVGRTPLDKWSVRRRDLCLTTHNTHNRQTSMPPVGFEPTIAAGERPQTYALDRAATGIGARNM